MKAVVYQVPCELSVTPVPDPVAGPGRGGSSCPAAIACCGTAQRA
jgi:hypothetical protein